MSKLEKMASKLNNDFRSICDTSMLKRFGVVTKTEFNIFDMQLRTSREDGKTFTSDQSQFLSGFSEGYAEAMNAVKRAAVEGV